MSAQIVDLKKQLGAVSGWLTKALDSLALGSRWRTEMRERVMMDLRKKKKGDSAPSPGRRDARVDG